MASGLVAALVATFAVGFVEGLGRLYPAPATWRRLRRVRGRSAVRAMRERFEHGGSRSSPRWIALVLGLLVVAWIAAASLLDKRWYEVLLDVFPYLLVILALLRTPSALRAVAERMKDYEREAGEDPDAEPDDEVGPTALAL